MISKFVNALMCLSIPVLVSCASIPDYELISSDTANVRFALEKGNFPPLANGVIDMEETLIAYIYDAGTCENQRRVEKLYMPSVKKRGTGDLSMPLSDYAKNSLHETRMDANLTQRVTLQFAYLRGGPLAPIERCNVSKDMRFQAGKNYEFVGTFETAGICSVKLNELTVDDGQAVRRLVETLTPETHPLDEACLVK